MSCKFTASLLSLLLILLGASLKAATLSDPALLNGLEWRGIGPAVMGGRISDIDGIPGDQAKPTQRRDPAACSEPMTAESPGHQSSITKAPYLSAPLLFSQIIQK